MNNSLPLEDNIFRLAYCSQKSQKEGRPPSLSEFGPRSNDNGKMSVDYKPLTTAEQSLARFGATFMPGSQNFKDHHSY